MMKRTMTRRGFVASVAAAGMAFATPALAQDIDYTDETIDFINFGAPGSPPDVWYRTLAPFLEKHIPGNPTINIINKPGAGSMIAANFTAQALPNDGFSIGSFNAVTLNKAAMGDESAEFDPSEMQVIGAQRLTRLIAVKKDGVASFDDLVGNEEPIVIGMQSDEARYSDAFLGLTGIEGKVISSYPRFPDALQALRTGEIDAMPMSVIEWLTFGPDLAESGAFPLIQYGYGSDGTVTPASAIDVETGHAVIERLSPDAVGGEEWNTMLIQASGQSVANQVWAPAGTPDEAVSILSQAFVDATSDPEFIAIHEKQYGLMPEWSDAATARTAIDGILASY